MLEVVHLDREAGGDVVGDGVEPAALLGGELNPGRGLLSEPALVPLGDDRGEGRQRLGRAEGVTEQADEVGGDAK